MIIVSDEAYAKRPGSEINEKNRLQTHTESSSKIQKGEWLYSGAGCILLGCSWPWRDFPMGARRSFPGPDQRVPACRALSDDGRCSFYRSNSGFKNRDESEVGKERLMPMRKSRGVAICPTLP